MNNAEINEFAWKLIQSFGDQASVEAGKREREAREAGKSDEANDWSQIRKVIEARKGAHES